MRSARVNPSSPFLGLVLVLVGLAWLCENLNLEPGRLLGPLWPWPLILMLLGVTSFMGRSESSFARGIALIMGGGIVWVSRTHLLPVPFWNIIAPLLVALVGGIVIWRSVGRFDPARSGRRERTRVIERREIE